MIARVRVKELGLVILERKILRGNVVTLQKQNRLRWL